VLAAFEDIAWPELRYPAQALESAAKWPEGCVSRATRLVCLFHDVGKLDKRWQAWARAYQEQVGAPIKSDFAAAHTDREANNPRHEAAECAIRAKYAKPHHASEGAYATSVVLNAALDRNEPLVRAAMAAIARHHTPFAQECEPYTLEPNAATHIQTTLRFLPEEMRKCVHLSQLKMEASSAHALPLAEPQDEFGWLAYLLLVRALRRSDQEGTAQGSKEGQICSNPPTT
jgi:CRISPR-associated endonuclease/helicase Cas3